VADRCALQRANWFEGIEGPFDLIVSNPPYIARHEMAGLAPELAFEPRMALTDEADGLSAYRAIVAGAPAHLVPGGRLMVEIGWQQGPDVAALFEAAGFSGIAILPDLDGRDRVVRGTHAAQAAP
jgi:release factor glutamine methyltransferase